MIVKNIIEHEDGTATVEFDFSSDEIQQLLSYAVEDILRKQITRLDETEKLPTFDEGTVCDAFWLGRTTSDSCEDHSEDILKKFLDGVQFA